MSGAPSELIPGIISLLPVKNRGAAFSILTGKQAGLIILSILLIVLLIVWLLIGKRSGGSAIVRIGAWLIIGGGIGNLCDRIRYGYVIDFFNLEFIHFAVFNMADVYIVSGAVLVLADLLSTQKDQRTDT